jgi:hypothetical protein
MIVTAAANIMIWIATASSFQHASIAAMPRRVYPPGPGAGAAGLIVITRPFESRGVGSAVAGTLTMARRKV